MASSFSELNGKWTFSANVRLRTGFKHKQPARLWNSKEEAAKDVRLFIWYSSLRDASDPLVPHSRGQWFKTILPDESWLGIRQFLDERGEKQYRDKKRKISCVSISEDIQRKRRAESKKCALKAVAEVAEEQVILPIQDGAKIEINRIPVMRKKFSELGARKQKYFRNMTKKKVEEHWAKISPSHPEELGKCMEDINFVHLIFSKF